MGSSLVFSDNVSYRGYFEFLKIFWIFYSFEFLFFVYFGLCLSCGRLSSNIWCFSVVIYIYKWQIKRLIGSLVSRSQHLRPTELRVIGCSCVCPAVNTCKSIFLVRLFPERNLLIFLPGSPSVNVLGACCIVKYLVGLCSQSLWVRL